MRMNFWRLLAGVSLAGLIGACMTENGGREEARGDARVTVKLRKAGELGKKADIEMERLVLVLSAEGEDTLRDTLPLSGNAQQTVTESFEPLAPGKIWTVTATAIDTGGIVIYGGATGFTVPPGGTQNVFLDLSARYSMLKARFFPIRDSVTRVELWMADTLTATESFDKQALVGDTVQLNFDYVDADFAGRQHFVKMRVYGEWQGVDTLLYAADTMITVVSGENASYAVSLRRVGPVAKGQAQMSVTLGAIGTVWIDNYLDTTYHAWDFAGSPGLGAPGWSTFPTVVLDAGGVAYATYVDLEGGGHVRVLRWNGGAWESLGSSGIASGASASTLALGGPEDHPCVAYHQQDNGVVWVRCWNGSDWEDRGSSAVTTSYTYNFLLVVDTTGAPYLAFMDEEVESKGRVKRWNGSAWEFVGSSAGISEGYGDLIIRLSSTGVPHVAYSEGDVVKVKHWNGSTWQEMTPVPAGGGVHGLGFVLDAEDRPLVAYGDYTEEYRASVQRWNGSAWEMVGSPGFSAFPATGMALDLDENQTPYIAFGKYASPDEGRLTVMRWNGDAWQTMPSPGVSSNTFTFAVHEPWRPWFGFEDPAISGKPSVLRYGPR